MGKGEIALTQDLVELAEREIALAQVFVSLSQELIALTKDLVALPECLITLIEIGIALCHKRSTLGSGLLELEPDLSAGAKSTKTCDQVHQGTPRSKLPVTTGQEVGAMRNRPRDLLRPAGSPRPFAAPPSASRS
ncbi:MAG: hypothetical protein WBW74_24275, partial [Xanthobacteraceae bacterium]